MNIYLLLLICGISQINGNYTESQEYYNPEDDNGAYMITMLFTKLNTILEENSALRKSVMEMNNRLQNQTESLHNVTFALKKLVKRQEHLENYLKKLTKNYEAMHNKFTEFSMNLKTSPQNNDWIVMLRREDGSENFYRDWCDYQKGFGNTSSEFFIGLEKLHNLTTFGRAQELLIILKDFSNQTRYAKYDRLVIGSESEKYSLKELGIYSGDAGDSLSSHRGAKFSTKDQDNDRDEFGDCANEFRGAWWFHNCYDSHLNGPYLDASSTIVGGINWRHWHGVKYSLKSVVMMIRSKT